MKYVPRKFVVTVLTAMLGIQNVAIMAAKKSKPEKPPTDQKMLVSGNTEFALDLYHQLQNEFGQEGEEYNLFFSPYSISTALAMTYGGARGETEKQMADVLHYNLGQDRLHSTFGKLQQDLDTEEKDKGYQLHVANALWGQKDYKFLEEYLQLTQKYYGAGLKQVDFVNEREKARNTINIWVENKTNNKIKNLIPKGILTGLTRLVLTNAIYFKGDWASKFKEENTKEEFFYTKPDRKIKVPLMHQTEEFRYGQTEELQILELPYKGEQLSMVIVLPKERNGLGRLEKQLKPDNLKDWQKTLRKRKVEVYLPKFTLTSTFSLSKTLAKMGMPYAFDIPARSADFSGMDGSKELFISAVLHKAFVEVNEEGTEAAAATAVVMSLRSMPLPPPIFRADHPFLFLIRDTRTDSILFMGRLVNPEAVK